jgi:6,7-dimethyl-8-ribityllumazine synthase
VVKGETDHYDHICRETIAGLMRLSLQFGLALGQGVLTVHRLDQARARSGRDGHNKGAEAAAAALIQVGLARRFGP